MQIMERPDEAGIADRRVASDAGHDDRSSTDRSVTMPQRVVSITGMHRSGTSLIARMLNLVGVTLGSTDRLMPAHDDNPKGYWENMDIVEINDEVLAMFGGTWDRPPRLPRGWEFVDELDPLRVRARSVIESIGADSECVMAWKDPRTSVLLPFWRTVTAIWANVVVVRHPFQVAGSLQVRDGMSPESAASLWTRHLVDAWLAHPNRALVNYDMAVADPATVGAQLAEFLGLDHPAPGIQQQLAAFADPALHHQTDAMFDPGPEMALALAIYAILESQPIAMVDAVFGAISDQRT